MPRLQSFRALFLFSSLVAAPAAAQLAPISVPKGLFRIELSGRFDNWDRRYLDGVKQDAASDFIRNPADGRWLAGLGSSEAALSRVTGVPGLSLSLGKASAAMLVNVGTGGIGAAYGLTSRLTIFGTVPIVRIRVQNQFRLDSTDATAGFNPADATFGDGTGGSTSLFFTQLDGALATLAARLAGTFYDGDPTVKALAQQTLTSATALQSNLLLLLGQSVFLPLSGSPGASALSTTIETLRARLLNDLSISGFDASPALPTRGPGGEELEGYATEITGPIQGRPFLPPVLSYIGDIEVGAAYTWLDRKPAAGGVGIRSALVGTVRLRTGQLDRNDSFFDLSTGDRQPDVQGDLVTDIARGRLGARVTMRYVLQLPGRQQRRLSAPDQPIAPIGLLAAVQRDPGEIVEASFEPFVRIGPTLALVAGVRYWSKAADVYTYVPSQTPIDGANPDVLALGSTENGTALSAGLSFSRGGARRDGRAGLPMDASLRLAMVTGSSLGRVPAKQSVTAMLRLYKKMF